MGMENIQRMLCENCKEREATVHYTEIVNGRAAKHHLCSDCAAQAEIMGYSSSEIPFVKLLTGMLAAGRTASPEDSPMQYVKCPKCGMSYEEFTQVGKFGCAECYNVFGPLMGENMKRLHGSDHHTGKVYTTEGKLQDEEKTGVLRELQELELKLKEAVMLENFEAAAYYRDEIKALKAKEGKSC